jgi:hypothetical protein
MVLATSAATTLTFAHHSQIFFHISLASAQRKQFGRNDLKQKPGIIHRAEVIESNSTCGIWPDEEEVSLRSSKWL